MAPFFSIILPVYNVKTYLQRCVESILRQGFTNYEIILVNDGSTDGSGWLCDEIAAKYPCVGVLHKKNGGLSSARNAGLELASGEYVWFVDSDDWIEERSLELLHKTLVAHTPDILKFNYYRVVNNSEVPVMSVVAPGNYSEDTARSLLQQACYQGGKTILSAWSHVYRRDFLLAHELEFVSERIVGSEDYLFNLQTYLMAQSIYVVDACLYNYELRAGSLSQTYKSDLPQRYTELYSRLMQHYEQADALTQYAGWLSAFYLWHLLRGACIPNAYRGGEKAHLKQGRREVAAFLKAKDCRKAYEICDKSHFSKKQKKFLFCMKCGLEPVFYWLYVVKPKKKKGSRNENQA